MRKNRLIRVKPILAIMLSCYVASSADAGCYRFAGSQQIERGCPGSLPEEIAGCIRITTYTVDGTLANGFCGSTSVRTDCKLNDRSMMKVVTEKCLCGMYDPSECDWINLTISIETVIQLHDS